MSDSAAGKANVQRRVGFITSNVIAADCKMKRAPQTVSGVEGNHGLVRR